ncbi:hypothetical protein NQ318_009630 [Aromia moschata]|uniref:GIY-YIG domain-containing protein n=1 Tax=Aromia moschata TaxID=1265417 RepID=A0AAV8Y8W7_9CUCU|nr:hypothetical protein NQ318_009630 [Aromia moschata]
MASLSDRIENIGPRTLLGNPKDKIDNNETSGIYEIRCKPCDQKYIGQTKRSILTRFKEHMAHLKYGRTEKSCVTQHAFENNHRIDINNLKLTRNVTNSRQPDDFESLEIIKSNSSMNKDNGPIPTSPLFAPINKDRCYGSVNRGNKFSINSAKNLGDLVLDLTFAYTEARRTRLGLVNIWGTQRSLYTCTKHQLWRRIHYAVSGRVRPSEILTRLQAQFGDETVSKTQVYEWHKCFSAGRKRVENEPHDRRPQTSIAEENICAVRFGNIQSSN